MLLVWTDGESPIWVPEWYPPRVSQYMFDPHSFMHILHGIILHLLMGRIIPISIGLPLALVIELGWEYLENTDFWIKMTSGPSGNKEEKKESIHHVVGAIICCFIGYFFSSFFLAIGVWWLSIVWIVVSEVGCLIYMRDNLFLFVLMMVYPVDTIKQWQEEAIPNKKLGIKKEVTDGRERADSIHGDDDDEDIDISDFEDSSNSVDENELRDRKKTRKTRKEIKVK